MSAPTSRTGYGGSPLSGGKNYSNVTLGKYNCLYIKLSARIGYGGLPCGRIISAPTKLRKQLKCYARVIMFELLQTVFTNGVQRHAAGDTVPNTETLKLLSKLYNVSINTLLGSPRELICQCCGMPLEDNVISREKDGFMNEDYCKWCYADGNYMYSDMDDLIDVCVKNMVNEEHSEEEVRAYLLKTLPKLDYWKRYKELGGNKAFEEFKSTLIDEINALNIEGMPKLAKLNALVGKYVNLEYRLPNGNTVKFLDDNATYLGNQLECEFGGDRCFGIVGNMDFILISTYEENGKNPELVLYKKR